MLLFCGLSVIVLKRQKISTRFFRVRQKTMYLQDRIKIWLISINPFLLRFQILPQTDPPRVDLSIGDIRQQIATEWLRNGNGEQETAIAM